MLAEINERDATGEIARIFEEVRALWGVPYVSAIHRHLATRPGVLEWAWEAVRPAFLSGRAQEAGWRAARDLGMPPLDPITRAALGVWGLDDAAVGTVRSTASGFERVAPVNMIFAGLVKRLLEGATPGGSTAAGATAWTPPASLPAPPPMVALESLDPAAREVLLTFATHAGGKPFVPGLYRMLAHWPSLVAHLATVLAPRLDSPQMTAACDEIRSRIDAAVPDVLAALPAIPTRRSMPGDAERTHFLTVGATYRKTSPELIVLGKLIREALPRET